MEEQEKLNKETAAGEDATAEDITHPEEGASAAEPEDQWKQFVRQELERVQSPAKDSTPADQTLMSFLERLPVDRLMDQAMNYFAKKNEKKSKKRKKKKKK